MSTTGVFGFIINDVEKVTFNHSHSYPGGLGNDILNYINAVTDFGELRVQVSDMKLVGKKKPTRTQIKKCEVADTINLDVGKQSDNDWMCLLNKAQGVPSKLIEIGLMIDTKDLLINSFMCEWAYIINLDTNELEVYKGVNAHPSGSGRYANKQSDMGYSIPYYGVNLIKKFNFNELPDKFDDVYDDEINAYNFHIIYDDEDWKNETIRIA